MVTLKYVGPNTDSWGTLEIMFFKVIIGVVNTNTLFPLF